MKYKITAEMDGESVNEVTSRVLAALYLADGDVESLRVEAIDPEFLAEEDPDHGNEVFQFPRIKELLNALNGEK